MQDKLDQCATSKAMGQPLKFPPYIPQPAREAILEWFDVGKDTRQDPLSELVDAQELSDTYSIREGERPCRMEGYGKCSFCPSEFRGAFDKSICVITEINTALSDRVRYLGFLMALGGLDRAALSLTGEYRSALERHPELDDASEWDIKRAYIGLMQSIQTDEQWRRFIFASVWANGDYVNIRSKLSEYQKLKQRASILADELADTIEKLKKVITELDYERAFKRPLIKMNRLNHVNSNLRRLSKAVKNTKAGRMSHHISAALSKQSRNQLTSYVRAMAGILIENHEHSMGDSIKLDSNVLKAIALIASIAHDDDVSYDYVRKALENFPRT